MYEVKYRNRQGKVVTCLVGAQAKDLAAAMAKLSDKDFVNLIHCKNAVGEVWRVSEV